MNHPDIQNAIYTGTLTTPTILTHVYEFERPQCSCGIPMAKSGSTEPLFRHGTEDFKQVMLQFIKRQWVCRKCKISRLDETPIEMADLKRYDGDMVKSAKFTKAFQEMIKADQSTTTQASVKHFITPMTAKQLRMLARTKGRNKNGGPRNPNYVSDGTYSAIYRYLHEHGASRMNDIVAAVEAQGFTGVMRAVNDVHADDILIKGTHGYRLADCALVAVLPWPAPSFVQPARVWAVAS